MVKRYDPDCNGEMLPDERGDFVWFGDFEAGLIERGLETYELRAKLKECETKLNQIAVERDLARKERDSVSHRLDAIRKLGEEFINERDDFAYDCGSRLLRLLESFKSGDVERQYTKSEASMIKDAYWIISKARGWIGDVKYDHLGEAAADWLKRAEAEGVNSETE